MPPWIATININTTNTSHSSRKKKRHNIYNNNNRTTVSRFLGLPVGAADGASRIIGSVQSKRLWIVSSFLKSPQVQPRNLVRLFYHLSLPLMMPVFRNLFFFPAPTRTQKLQPASLTTTVLYQQAPGSSATVLWTSCSPRCQTPDYPLSRSSCIIGRRVCANLGWYHRSINHNAFFSINNNNNN